MIFQSYISTPIVLHTTTPKRTVLKVAKGLVYKVEVEFPAGPIGLLRCQIYDGSFQLWPSTPGEFFKSDDLLISFDDTFLKLTPPYQFDILTWNDDDTYAHGVTVRLGIVSKEIFMARYLPTYGYQELTKILQAEQRKQELEREAIIKQPFSWIREEEW